MLINDSCKHILSNLYEYDFSACYYNILKNIGYDLSNINFEDKEQRNIQLGLLQKNNKKLSEFLYSKTKDLIDIYLSENSIEKEDVIWRQKDGIILTKPLSKLNISMKIDYRGYISKLVSNMTRNRILLIYNGKSVTVKGVPNKPIDTSFFDLFLNLDYTNKKHMIDTLEDMRIRVLKSNNIKWFIRENENRFYIPIKEIGLIEIHKSTFNSIIPDDIDKNFIWTDYIWPFVQTIMIYYK